MKKYLLISLFVLSGFDKALMADMDTDGIVEYNVTRFIKYCLKDWLSFFKKPFKGSLLKNMSLIQQEIYDNLNVFDNIQDLCGGIQGPYQCDKILKEIDKTSMKLDNICNSIKQLEGKTVNEFIFYKVNQANVLINKEVVDLQNNIRWITKEKCPIQTLKKMQQEESKRRINGE